MHYGADTSGCPIECVPDLIRKRAYELYEARGALRPARAGTGVQRGP